MMIPSGNVVSVGGSSHHGSAMEFKRSRSDSITSAGSNGSAHRRGVMLDHHSMNAYRRPLEEFLTALRKGTDLMKHGRHGKPKVHYFRLAERDTHLTWRSAKGNQRGVPLECVKQVVPGQATEIFKRHPMPQFARLSFSLVYKEEKDNEARTLDLTCKNEQEFNLWFWGIQAVMEQVCSTSTPQSVSSPMQPSVMGSPAGAFPSMSFHGPFAVAATSTGASYQQSLQSDPQGMGGGTAMGRASGAMGVPAPVHVPGDCYVWGSSDTTSAGSKPGASAVPGWLNSSVPTLVDNTTHLDVCEVAVSLRHAALVTHRGELYTWGQGSGGKLGLGNHQNADSPQRVYTLWGKSVKRVSCGDGCTAAITHDGELYTWGDGAGGNLGYGNTLRQFIPRQVEKGLGDFSIVQVSCGPFHTCAVSSGGRLFSWGDGLCGKLGHGHSDTCAEPRQVSSLADMTVLHVACGVWHTACIARPQQSQDNAGTVSYLEGPATGSLSFEDSTGGGLLGQTRGDLFTWGGEFTWVDQRKDKAGNVTSKRDSHKGCLGLGDADGRLVPTRVMGPWPEGAVQQVEAGLNLTVVLTSDGQCFQMGETGASGHVKWDGCKEPELVGGPLSGFAVERISVGMQHVAAQASPIDKKTGLPQLGSEFSGLFMWGRGREGQLGVGTHQDNSVPKMVDELKGRRVLQVACGGYHTLAVCAHDATQQEAAEKQSGYKKKMMNFFSKPSVSVDLPDSRQHSTGPNTAGSGAVTPLDRVSEASMSLMAHNSNDLAVTPRKGAGDEHFASSRNGRQPSSKSTSTNSMMGLVRAAQAVRRSKNNGLARKSGESKAEHGPGFRASGSKRYADSRVPQRFRLQAANSTEMIGSKEGARASSDVGGWGPERSRASQAESELGSIVSAPDIYPEDSGLIEELVAEAEAREQHWQSEVQGLQSKVEKLEGLLQREMGHHQLNSPTPRPVYDLSPVGLGPARQQSRYPLSPDDRQMPSSPSGRDPTSEPRLPSDRRASAMGRTADLRAGEGRRTSFGQLSYADMGERRETLSREAAAEMRGYTDRASELRNSPDSKSFTRRGSGMGSDSDKAELDRERRELRQMRAELERRVVEFDKRQSKLVAERRGSTSKGEGSNAGSPFRGERNMSQQSSSDLDKSLMQMGSRQSSGGSQAGPRQAMTNDLAASRASPKGHRRTASSGQGVATAGALGPEWTEEVDQGVFLTFARLGNGQNSLTRIRFNRQHFDKAAASVWWQNNKVEMGLRYNIASNSGTPTGLHTPDSESAPTVAGASPPHHRRSVSANQLSHLQEFAITSVAGSGTIFASHSPRAAPPNPAFALPSPTAHSIDGLTSHPVSVSASGASDASFATPLAPPLPSPLMSPLRGDQGGAAGGLSPGAGAQRSGSIVKATSPPSGVRWGRLGAEDHMFSLPITPTAHLTSRAFAPGGHNSRLSHVSRAEPKGYAARHSLLESQHTVDRTSSGNPFAPSANHAFSQSERFSTPAASPVPRHSTTASRNSNRSTRRSSEAGSGFGDTALPAHEAKSYARSSTAHVNVDAYSNIAMSEVSSFGGNESSYVSSSSSQESESHGPVQPQLRVISLDQESGRIMSADSPRGASRVLAWHPSSTGVSDNPHSIAPSDRSATSASSRGSFSVKPLKVPDPSFLEPGSSGSPRIDAWSPRTGSRSGFGPASPHRFSSPSLEGGVPLARASPKARASDLGAGATARSRLARGQSSGYAVRRGASELPPS